MTRQKRLGRGLEALLNTTDEAVRGNVAFADDVDPRSYDYDSNRLVHLEVHDIEPNPFQPRKEFNPAEIDSLAESLKEHELLQPILVRIVDGRYQLISGERRLRAAIKAKWATIPSRIREADDRMMSELAIVENLQRKDLNPIEKALSFKNYIDQHQCRQEYLAQRLKIDRSTIANIIRLLELPEPIQNWLVEGKLTIGHARTLLPLGDEKIQIEFAEQIIKEGLTVRNVEQAVGELLSAEKDSQEGGDALGFVRRQRTRNAQVSSLETDFRLALGTKTKIKYGTKQNNGQIVIYFDNDNEFKRLKELITRQS